MVGWLVAGSIELGVEVLLSGISVEGVDRLVDEVAVEVMLAGARDIMGGIVMVGLNEAGRAVVSLSVVNLSEVNVERLLTLYE